MKTPEWSQSRRLDIFIANCEHVSHLVQIFLLLTSNMYFFAGFDEYNGIIIWDFQLGNNFVSDVSKCNTQFFFFEKILLCKLSLVS